VLEIRDMGTTHLVNVARLLQRKAVMLAKLKDRHHWLSLPRPPDDASDLVHDAFGQEMEAHLEDWPNRVRKIAVDVLCHEPTYCAVSNELEARGLVVPLPRGSRP